MQPAETARDWDVLLIGGVSGAGKTTAAVELARQLAIPWLGVDDLRLAFQCSRVTLPAKTDSLYFFLDTPGVWSYPPERLRDELIAVAGVMTPAIEVVIENHLHNAGPLIIEGDGVHPALVERELPRQRIASGRLRAVFVHEPDESMLLGNFLARARAVEGRSEAELRREACAKALFSEWIAREAARCGLPVIASQPFGSLAQRILAAAALPHPG
jgi:2-phosphoglycerate kinase